MRATLSLSDHGVVANAADASMHPLATGAPAAASSGAIPSTVYSRAAPSNLLADAAQLRSLRSYDRRMRARAVQKAKQIPLAVSTRISDEATVVAEAPPPAQPSPRAAQHASSADRRLSHRSSTLSVNHAKATATPAALFHNDAFDPPLRRQEIVSSRAWLNSASDRPVDAATIDDGDGDEAGAPAPSALQGLNLNGRKKMFSASSSTSAEAPPASTTAGAQAILNAGRLPSQTQDEVERFYASVVPPSVSLSSAGAGSHHAHSHSVSSSSPSHHGVLPSLASPRRFAPTHGSASKKRNGGGGGGGGGRSPSPKGKATAAAAAKNAQQQQQRNSASSRAAARPGTQQADARSPGNGNPRPQPLASLSLSALASSRSPARPSTSEKVAFSIDALPPHSARSAATSDGWSRSNCTSAATLRSSPPRSLAPSPALLEEEEEEEGEEEVYTWNPSPSRMEQQPRVGADGIAVRGVRELKDEFVLLRARAQVPQPPMPLADLGLALPHPVPGHGPLSPVHSPRHGRLGMFGGQAAMMAPSGEEKSQLHPAYGSNGAAMAATDQRSFSFRLQPQPILSPRRMQVQSQWGQLGADAATFGFDASSSQNGASDAAAFSPQQQQQPWMAHSSPSVVATPARPTPLAHLPLDDDAEHVYEFRSPARPGTQSLWQQPQLPPAAAAAASPTARMVSPSPPLASADRASLPGSPLLQSLQWESPRSSLAYSRVRDRLPQQQTQP